ncbi:MAG TPA: threonine ammonia-lyase [Pirellulaceae bacterium]|nr:threonine ammonia-lyase [Pirellulaceae bacterium]
MPVTLDDIRAAKDRIAGAVAVSPCPESPALSDLTGCRVFCKLDSLQRTGSFKERGARNALLLLPQEQQKCGVIAASAGNHALALACHGRGLGIPVTVVMPRFAPLIKVATCRRFAANVVLHGSDFAEAKAKADELASAHGLTYIHGYDDPAVIAGQGTIGLELLEQVPGLEAVVVPVGGAGLIAGIALAIKSLQPTVQIIGVEDEVMPSFTCALEAGQSVAVPARPTLADGLATTRVGVNALAIAQGRVDRAVTVSEELIALSILRLIELEKSVVEGAAAAPLAALLSGKLPELRGKCVALILAGGNIDPLILGRVIDVGMAADGRLARLVATISDRPGGLAHLARVVAESGASIQQITHDRVFSGPDVSSVRVICDVETRDRNHLDELRAALQRSGIELRT